MDYAVQQDVAVAANQRARNRRDQWNPWSDPQDAVLVPGSETIPQHERVFQHRPADDDSQQSDQGDRPQIGVEEPVVRPVPSEHSPLLWTAGSLSMTTCVTPKIRKLKYC